MHVSVPEGDERPRPGDLGMAEITYAAPHHLVADGGVTGLRRTRGGDAWDAKIRGQMRDMTLGNSLLVDEGGRYRNATKEAGVAYGQWAWASEFLDFDADGRLMDERAAKAVTGLMAALRREMARTAV